MFYYVCGTVAHIAPNLAVIDCNGVAYACQTTNYSLADLEKGKEGKLYTHMRMSEQQATAELFGFSSLEEKSCFQMLIGISGVGPKAALSILSANTPQGLAMAILAGDEKALSIAPGIGKKIAQRIILELKDKLAKSDLGGRETYRGSGITILPENKQSEAAAALSVLGYSGEEILIALKDLDIDALPLEEIVRQALRRMVKG